MIPTRREVLNCALAVLGSAGMAGVGAARPAFAQGAVDGADAASGDVAAFDGPFCAWRGYTSTAAASMVPGAVPVSAPASASERFRVEVDGHAACALRQVGQATYLYVAVGSDLVRLDAATGEEAARVELSGASIGRVAFADSVLTVALADGRLEAFDEDLMRAWISEAVEASTEGTWGAASAIAVFGGYICAAFTAEGASGRVSRLAAFASLDGQLLWERELEAFGDLAADGAAVADGAAAPVPVDVLATDDLLLVSDGGSELGLISITTGEELDRLDMGTGAEVRGRMARVPAASSGEEDGALFLLGGADGGVRTVRADEHGLAVLAVCETGCDLQEVPPAFAGSLACFMGSDRGETALVALDVAGLGAGELSLAGAVSVAQERVVAAPLAVTFGGNVREARVQVYAALADGRMAAVEFPPDAFDGAQVDEVVAAGALPGASVAGAGLELLADRDGALVCAASGAVAVLAPDEARAQATATGGAVGLDTIGASLSGITLPNGAGVGVGALVLAAAAGGYFFIRNGGGRRAEDEGLDAWRAKRGRRGDDGDGRR